MRRREFLGAGGVAALSGCPRVLPADTVRIEMAEIANADKSSGHTVRVRLGDRGDVVYEGTHRLDRRDGTVAPSVVLDDELPDDPGRYVATAWLDGSDDPSRLAVADHAGADCVVLLVMVFESGLGITTMDRCGG